MDYPIWEFWNLCTLPAAGRHCYKYEELNQDRSLCVWFLLEFILKITTGSVLFLLGVFLFRKFSAEEIYVRCGGEAKKMFHFGTSGHIRYCKKEINCVPVCVHEYVGSISATWVGLNKAVSSVLYPRASYKASFLSK